MARVFLTQSPVVTDRDTGQVVPRFDVSPAEEYGTLVILLPTSLIGTTAEWVVDELRTKLADMTPDDYFLPLGDPKAVALAAAVIGDRLDGYLPLLTWSARAGRYVLYDASVTGEEEGNNE